MTPLELYQKKLDRDEIQADQQQAPVVDYLETIYQALCKRQQLRDSQLGRLRRKIKPRAPVQGLYLWGKVGAGKTLLLDLLYDCLPVRKMRWHFHAFMQQIHQALQATQGQKDPLQRIAQQLSEEAVVLCFDEFCVFNVADAMILGELFHALFQRGLCLITTANLAPDDLYKGGIQRERFLPAIAIIKQHVRTVHLQAKQDYRLRHTTSVTGYYNALDPETDQQLDARFNAMAGAHTVLYSPVVVLGRRIPVVKRTETNIWFDFEAICGRPRSQNDYLELARHYRVFFVSQIPVLDQVGTDALLSFIHLIDVLYDTQRLLIISAAAPVTALYHGTAHRAAFLRTESRLIEMGRGETAFPSGET